MPGTVEATTTISVPKWLGSLTALQHVLADAEEASIATGPVVWVLRPGSERVPLHLPFREANPSVETVFGKALIPVYKKVISYSRNGSEGMRQ